MGVREEREWGVRGMWGERDVGREMWGERDVGCEREVRERVCEMREWM